MAEALSPTRAREALERYKNRLANLREEAKHATRTGVGALVVVGGGAAAGALQAKLPYLPGTQIPTAAAVGAALVTAAMTGMLEDQSDHVASFGAGMLAAITARETEKMLAAA